MTKFRHHLLLLYRNFQRYKSSYIINLTGLSTGLAFVLLIFLWVKDESSYNTFHKKGHQLFQILRNYEEADNIIHTSENNSPLLAPALIEEMPEIEYVVPVRDFGNGILSADNNTIKAIGMFAGTDFFNLFSYNLLFGDKDHVLNEKNNMVISDEIATKLFGLSSDIIGKRIELNHERFGGVFNISGVFEKTKYNSTEKFDFILTNELLLGKISGNNSWHSNVASVYLSLKEGTNARQFNEKIRNFIKSKYIALYGENDQNLRYVGSLFLQQYSDKYLFNNFENGRQEGGRIEYVRIFSIIALFILIIACINFMNLATAKASRRFKEIGIKMAFGAGRRTLIFQYLGESILITLLSMIVALVLTAILLQPFNEITGKHLALELNPDLLLTITIIALVTGLISGSYPALYLSGFNPVRILKGELNSFSLESLTRNALIVFQFIISIVLIISMFVFYAQIDFIQTKNLGYNKDNIMHFENIGKLRQNSTSFIQELQKIPGVIYASSMKGDLVGLHRGGSGISWPGQAPDQKIEFSGLDMDYDMIELLELELAEGRPFSRKFSSDNSAVIFNEAAISAMGLRDPVGTKVKLWGDEKEIIGIVKNFNFESLYKEITPFFLSYSDNNMAFFVKLKGGSENEIIPKIRKLYQSYNSGFPFEYQFLDEDYQALYDSEQRIAILSGYFSGIAIIISCLGLFGLSAFLAEKRMKEISIRKVSGAGEIDILLLLSGNFNKIVLVANLIALPLSYILMKHWLDNFAYKTELNLSYFFAAGSISFLIAWITVASQTLKAVNVNPVDSLRSE